MFQRKNATPKNIYNVIVINVNIFGDCFWFTYPPVDGAVPRAS